MIFLLNTAMFGLCAWSHSLLRGKAHISNWSSPIPNWSTGEGSHLKTCEIWWHRGNEHVWIIHSWRWTSYNPIYSWYNYPFSSPKKDGVAHVEVTPWYFPFLWWSAAWWPCPSTSSWRCPASAWAGASNFAMRPAGKLQRRRKRWRHREMGTPGPKYQNKNCSIFVVKDDLIFDPPPPKMYIEVGRCREAGHFSYISTPPPFETGIYCMIFLGKLRDYLKRWGVLHFQYLASKACLEHWFCMSMDLDAHGVFLGNLTK